MAFNSREYEWADLTMILGGRDVVGFRAIKYSEKIEREAVYAKGRNAHSIQSGNSAVNGEVTMLQSEYEALVVSGKGSIMSLSLDALVAYGNPLNLDAIVKDRIVGIRFTESSKELKQGDKFMEITLPFVALRIQNQV
ncbi:hypothetical protein MW871_15060 [Flavobacterium sp. I-SCBP12n]|uniref:Uncharacterized protein n=1 Tax=Flavobacterium pygoscelis TaxID=2893176 RepID=A0A9X1XUQ8_9FLAO|nr:hypothetical protein [Flavobacterium pygoscelis]MCK8143208.1 hypothetical protein [Flavobacterium pygoscelis]